MIPQLFGFILSIAGLCGLIIGTFTNEWKTLGQDNDQTLVLDKYEGLWMECSVHKSSRVECISFNSLLHQNFQIRVSRVTLILSIVLSSLAALLAISGLRCTKCMEDNEKGKDGVAVVGGILSMFSGFMALGITSWYIYAIVDDFHQNETAKERYVVGRSLVGAFGSSLLSVLGGVFLCACSVMHLRSNRRPSNHLDSKSPEKHYV